MTSAPSKYRSASTVAPCFYCGAPAGARALRIGEDPPPAALMSALGLVRAAAAHANGECGELELAVAGSIERAALALAQGMAERWGRSVWQDGGGLGLAYPLDAAILEDARRFAEVAASDVRRNQCV